MKTLKTTIILLFLSLCLGLNAQNPSLNEALQRRAAEKVGQMNDYISFLADKKKDFETRKYYKEKALNLFIGSGEAYEENGIMKKGVYMETTSIYRKKATNRLMKDYFTGLMNLRYSEVKIEATEVAEIKVSNLKKIGENQFECTCYFDQAFCGYRDGIPVYRDITRKKVTCHVFVEDTVDGQEFVVLLGDVTALETTRV